MGRRHYIEVEVDADEVLDDLSSEELIEELRSRDPQYDPAAGDLTYNAYMALCRGDLNEAKTLLERALWPKFKTVLACREAYEKRSAT